MNIKQGKPGNYNLGIITEIEDDDGNIILGGKFKKRRKQNELAQDILDRII